MLYERLQGAGICACSGCTDTDAYCTSFTASCRAEKGTVTPICGADTLQCVGIECDSATDGGRCNTYCATVGCTDGLFACVTENVPTCVPAAATVTLEDGTTKTMAQLAIGDRVLVAANTYSPVYMFSHQLEAVKTAFVTLTAGDATLQLTPGHYLYVNGQLAVARTVRVGDRVTLADGTTAAVTAVRTEWAAGLYNPHTLHGDIVVNGILTSTYTQGIAPAVAHVALWPVRALYQAGVAVAEGAFANGADVLASALPQGQVKY